MAPHVLVLYGVSPIGRDKYDRLEKRHMWLERTDTHVGGLRGKCPCSLLKVQTFCLYGYRLGSGELADWTPIRERANSLTMGSPFT